MYNTIYHIHCHRLKYMYVCIYIYVCIYVYTYYGRYIYIYLYRRLFPTQQWYIYAAICSTWFDQNGKKDRTVVELPFDVPNGALGHPGISPGHRFPYDIYRDWNFIYWYVLLVNGNISTYQQYMSLYIVIMGLLVYIVDNGIYCYLMGNHHVRQIGYELPIFSGGRIVILYNINYYIWGHIPFVNMQ
jgi:hypothetical protein